MANARALDFIQDLLDVIARDESIAHEDLIGFLMAAGYEKHVTCEMPGQYAVRGGIIDVFSPETPQPVRIELLGDTIESIRAFDPNTQRSTNPVERAALLPLDELQRHAEVLERQRVGSGIWPRRRCRARGFLRRLGISRDANAKNVPACCSISLRIQS